MEPTMVLRLEHALVPAHDATVIGAMSEIMTRPCFASLKRMSLETRRGRNMRHTKPSAEAIRAYLCDPKCEIVDMDSGRQGDLTAKARLPTGLPLEPDCWDAFPAPLELHMPAPEWGLFLSRGHLEKVPASALEDSGVFHQVRRLGDELVFLQLTADPADALRPDFDALLDPVRRVLVPILSQPRADDAS